MPPRPSWCDPETVASLPLLPWPHAVYSIAENTESLYTVEGSLDHSSHADLLTAWNLGEYVPDPATARDQAHRQLPILGGSRATRTMPPRGAGHHQIQFVHLNNPADGSSPDIKRRVRAHAARSAHARNRRCRAQGPWPRSIRVDSESPGTEGSTSSSSSSGTPSKDRLSASTVLALKHAGTVLPHPHPIHVLTSHRRDPLASHTYPFKPVEYYLLEHYVVNVLPFMGSFCTHLTDPEQLAFLERMTTSFMQLALTNVGFLGGVFLASSRHLCIAQQQKRTFRDLALYYKSTCMRDVNRELSQGAGADIGAATFAKVMMLVWDDLFLGDMARATIHIHGALKMIEATGGNPYPGLEAFAHEILRLKLEEHPSPDSTTRIEELEDDPELPMSQCLIHVEEQKVRGYPGIESGTSRKCKLQDGP